MTKVSILMNCYNGERFLREALDSVFAQTFVDWEIIFVDNCSTDQSAKIASSYGSKIKYYKTSELISLGAARRFGLEFCGGEYLAVLDVDNRWHENFLKTRVAFMDTHQDYLMAYGGIQRIDDVNKALTKSIPQKKQGIIFPQLLKQFDIEPSTTLTRLNVLEASQITFDEKITASEEYCLYMQLAIRYQMAAFEDVLIDYRVSNSSLTFKAIDKWANERIYTLKLIEQNFPNLRNQFPKEFKEAYARAEYYEARALMKRGDKAMAKKTMSLIKYVSYKYFILYLLISLFPSLWRKIHKEFLGAA